MALFALDETNISAITRLPLLLRSPTLKPSSEKTLGTPKSLLTTSKLSLEEIFSFR